MVALAAAAVTACGFAIAQQAPLKGSFVVDWNSIPDKPNDSGSVRTFFRTKTATLDELEVHVTTLNPRQAPHPPHQHPNEEMLIIKQGTLEALINGEWKRVGPGSVIFLASNVLHGVRNVGKDPAIYHVIGFRTAATPPDPPKTAAGSSGN
jgi:quercetin dioxygenase-like cupin family protein